MPRRPSPVRSVLGLVLAATVLVTLRAGGDERAEAADVARIDCADLGDAPAEPSRQLASFESQTPNRVVDTRDGTGGVDEQVPDGCVLRIDVSAAGVPDDASALALSVTALGELRGFQQVFPCAGGRPASSNVNNRSDRFPTPNLVVGLPDDDGDVCIWTKHEADLLVDVAGWWSEEGPTRFRAVDPVRVDDSRDTPGLAPGGRTPRPIDLSAHVPPGTTAIVANLTVAQPAARGDLAIFPCGGAAPRASNLNFAPGEARAVGVVVGLDAQRRVCTASSTPHHVLLDLVGYYAPAPEWGPAAELRVEPGTRLADSRRGTGGWTTPLAAGETRRLDIAERLPDGDQVTGVILNVTVTLPEARGHLSVTGCGTGDAETSAVNYAPGSVASNLVVVDLGTVSDICVFSKVGAEVIVDLFGVFRAETDEMLAERIEVGADAWPPYRPDASDFVTTCGDPLRIDLDLLAGTLARVNGVTVPAGVTEVGIASPDELVRLDLRRAGVVQRHHVRCVPDDFRRLDVTVADDPTPGWYVTTVRGVDGSTERVVILDEFGAPVWHLDTPVPIAVAERAEDGDLLLLPIRGRAFSVDPDDGGVLARLDGSVVDEYVTVDGATEVPTDHHDVVELPGGGVALIAYPLVEGVDLTALGPGFTADDLMTDNVIQELDADGNLVWEWRMSDHVAFEPGAGGPTDPPLVATHDEIPYPQRWGVDRGFPGVEDVDVFHINSIDLADDGSGDYIVSARHVDAIFRIDRTTGDIVWILRSDEVTADPKAGADAVLTIVDDPLGGPRRPHDAILDGDLLTFLDNRVDTADPSRAVTYLIDTSGPGPGTATLVDEIVESNGATSRGLGSNRPGPDGGRVVHFGGPLQPFLVQYDAEGEATMTVSAPGGGNPYRVVWYPEDTFDAITLRALSGQALDIPGWTWPG